MASGGSSSSATATRPHPSSIRRQREITNIKAPLWDHVEVLEKAKTGGGNSRWKCKFCGYIGFSSYSRIKNHLLKVPNGGIHPCKKVTVEILFELKNEVARAAAVVESSKPRHVPLSSNAGTSTSASVASHSLDSGKRNALTPERAEDLVFVHNNLRLLSRRSNAYKTGASRMWDVGGDAFESLSGVGILEVANLSIEEPELESVSFGDVDAPIVVEEDQDQENEDGE